MDTQTLALPAVTARHTDQLRIARVHVTVEGAVQGVGFRSFVYRLATEAGLTGWVLNDTHRVEIEVEGAAELLERFLSQLSAERPPLALIDQIDMGWLEPAGYANFEIRHSQGSGSRTTLVLPDMATCHDCLDDVFDPNNRRAGYAFTNCTNCGPRFSIIQALPYDRTKTTMRSFGLCSACRAEYGDPLNRRFHPQPNACPVCGPRLALWGPTTGLARPRSSPRTTRRYPWRPRRCARA